jgi:hypothetical protein
MPKQKKFIFLLPVLTEGTFTSEDNKSFRSRKTLEIKGFLCNFLAFCWKDPDSRPRNLQTDSTDPDPKH